VTTEVVKIAVFWTVTPWSLVFQFIMQKISLTYPEDRGSGLIRNAGTDLPNYSPSHPVTP
jgi:hypothetical protein